MIALLDALGLGLLAASLAPACVQGWRVERAVRFVARHGPRRSSAAASPSHPAPLRILLIGDSTGVGVGCHDVLRESIEARLAADWPHAVIVNRSVNGARVGDLVRALAATQDVAGSDPPFDVAVLQVGGNDAIGFTPLAPIAGQADALMRGLTRIARRVVWAGPPNIGLAPLFVPPFSWWMSARTRRLNAALRAAARAHGAEYVDFFREASQDPFSANAAEYFAIDGIHPSPAAYAYCWRHMRPAIARAVECESSRGDAAGLSTAAPALDF